jgi:hypothetical protein
MRGMRIYGTPVVIAYLPILYDLGYGVSSDEVISRDTRLTETKDGLVTALTTKQYGRGSF